MQVVFSTRSGLPVPKAIQYDKTFDPSNEADAILAEATTAQGAIDLANDLNPEALDGIVQVIAIACSVQSSDQINVALGRTVRSWLMAQAERIAITRHQEGR